MCRFPRYRLPVPKFLVYKKHRKGYGYSGKSQAFIVDKRNTDIMGALMNFYSAYLDKLQEIPCGQCLECRIRSSKELAQRALAESTMHASSWFVTLTYDDSHIQSTFRETVSRVSGEYGLHPSLVKRDFQLFAKNLRKTVADRCEPELVIFYCGEYGPTHGRPHFHAIIYGLQLHDLKLHKVENGVSYYTSDTIADAWRDFEHQGKDATPRGFHLVTEVSWDTCAYVARYVTKKMIGKSEKDYISYCFDHNVEPQQREFHQGPKRPGLGLTYLQEHMLDIYERDKIVLPGGKLERPCSYYDKKFDIEYPGTIEKIKETRAYNYKKKYQLSHDGMSPEQAAAYDARSSEILERKLKRQTVRSDL